MYVPNGIYIPEDHKLNTHHWEKFKPVCVLSILWGLHWVGELYSVCKTVQAYRHMCPFHWAEKKTNILEKLWSLTPKSRQKIFQHFSICVTWDILSWNCDFFFNAVPVLGVLICANMDLQGLLFGMFSICGLQQFRFYAFIHFFIIA